MIPRRSGGHAPGPAWESIPILIRRSIVTLWGGSRTSPCGRGAWYSGITGEFGGLARKDDQSNLLIKPTPTHELGSPMGTRTGMILLLMSMGGVAIAVTVALISQTRSKNLEHELSYTARFFPTWK